MNTRLLSRALADQCLTFGLLFLAAASLACGGGGGSSSPTTPGPTGTRYLLEIKPGFGVISTPSATVDYPAGTAVPYRMVGPDPQAAVQAYLDGVAIPSSGSLTMDRAHVLSAVVDNRPGVYAPEFSGVTVGGQTIRLSDYRGAWVFLDFSEVTCPGSVNCADYLQAHRSAWKAKGIEILTIMVHGASGGPATSADLTLWQTTHGLTFPVVNDPAGITAIYNWGIGSGTTDFPTGYFVDPTGIIRAKFRGFDGPTIDAAMVGLGL